VAEDHILCPETFGENLPAVRARAVFSMLAVGGSAAH
jgi:hypothetical protein